MAMLILIAVALAALVAWACWEIHNAPTIEDEFALWDLIEPMPDCDPGSVMGDQNHDDA